MTKKVLIKDVYDKLRKAYDDLQDVIELELKDSEDIVSYLKREEEIYETIITYQSIIDNFDINTTVEEYEYTVSTLKNALEWKRDQLRRLHKFKQAYHDDTNILNRYNEVRDDVIKMENALQRIYNSNYVSINTTTEI